MKITGKILPGLLFTNILFNVIIHSCYSFNNKQKSNEIMHNDSLSEQTNIVQYDTITQLSVYIFTKKMPQYEGGDAAFLRDFSKAFKYDPHQNSNNALQTKLNFQFVIDNKGKLIGARICNKKTELTAFEKAGLRALNTLQNWQAGIHNEQAVNVLLTRSIHIDVNRKE